MIFLSKKGIGNRERGTVSCSLFPDGIKESDLPVAFFEVGFKSPPQRSCCLLPVAFLIQTFDIKSATTVEHLRIDLVYTFFSTT